MQSIIIRGKRTLNSSVGRTVLHSKYQHKINRTYICIFVSDTQKNLMNPFKVSEVNKSFKKMFCVGPYSASKQQIIQMRIPKLPVDLFLLSG